jgi:hypothetical protein
LATSPLAPATCAIGFTKPRTTSIRIQELRHVLMGVKDDLHFAQPKGDEGRLVDTLKITDDEDAKIAHRILELYRELWIRLTR